MITYVFSLSYIINGNNNDEKEEKNEINLETIDNDLKLYKDEKVIEIDEALKILLFSVGYLIICSE